MSAAPFAAFDGLAATYDERWSRTPAGRLQRQAVWRHVDPLIECGHRVLDLGCGTGEDSLHLTGLGASVLASDASSEMVARARAKGVNAEVIRIEELSKARGTYDLILSNFGALNCVQDLSGLREPLARMIRPNGHLAICLMGRFCLWESVYYALKGRYRKTARRWSGAATALRGLPVYYPLIRNVRTAFAPEFVACRSAGIGVCVPPSFVPALPARLLSLFDQIDRRIAETMLARVVADHRLLVFRRT